MPGYKAAKDRLTLLFGGNASGDMKLKPLLVYHSESPKALRNIAKGSLPVVWKSNPKAWVTQAIFQDWFFHHFIPEVEIYCLEKDIFCCSTVLWATSIHGRLLSQHQSTVSATECYIAHPTYGPSGKSGFQEMSHFLSGSKGE